MSYKNTVKDYSQMIGWLTRDKTTDVPGSMAHGLRTGLYDGGRAGFNNGQLVQPSVDGLRPGYSGKKAPTVDNSKIKIFQHKSQDGKKYTGQPYVRDATKKKELPPNAVRRGEKIIFLGDNAMANAEAFSQTFKKKGGDINELRRLIDEANDGFKFVKIKDLQVKAGFSKDTSFLPKDNIYGSLDTMKDKAKKAFDYVFSDSNKPVKDMFDPMSQIKKLIGMSDKNAVGPFLQGYVPYEDNKLLIKNLAVPKSKAKLIKAEGLTLGELEFRIDNNIKGDELFAPPRQVSPETKIMDIVDRHIKQGGTKIEWVVKPEITKGGYPSYGDAVFKYKGKEYDIGRLINEARDDPNFKEFFKAQREYKTLNDKIVTHPKTGEKIRFGNLMKEVYGSSIVPYNIDHAKSILDEPFTSLRVLPSRINMAAGNIKSFEEQFITNPQLAGKYSDAGKEMQLKKIGYNYNQSIDDLINAELKLADDVLNKGRVLRKPNEIIESIRKGEDYVPDFYSKDAKPGKGFEKIIPNIENTLASFGDGTCAVQFGPKKRDGGRIGYQVGTIDKKRCIDQGVKNFKEGKFKTANQAQDAARLLGGGKNVLRAITKYGIVPEAAFVAGEAVFRNILGEKPLNAIKKSIDTFTFGLTDFTSGIEAAKFGKFSNQKLAVDKFRNSQALVNSLQNKLKNLEGISDQGGEGYVGDLTSDIQITQAKLQAAKQELQKNTVSPDIVQFIDRKAEEIADAQMAKSSFAKASLKDQMEGIPGVADYMDTETARVFPRQPSQAELNLKLLPNFREALKTKEAKMDRVILNAPDDVLKDISPEALDLKRGLQEAYKMENLKDVFGAEQIYGTQGSFFGEPLAKGGRAGYKTGSVRKGVLSLIDESIKKTPKDTTSALDKLIKKTLDEDLFDKKDRIIDTLNAKIAKERKKYSYNQKVFEEPSQLEFYNNIIKSNFKTKTGPFFDYQKRKNKAGGGILKQAGDRSGPPPESGPNSQGLQGLLNRGKNI